jgi:hypothetical protein
MGIFFFFLYSSVCFRSLGYRERKEEEEEKITMVRLKRTKDGGDKEQK